MRCGFGSARLRAEGHLFNSVDFQELVHDGAAAHSLQIFFSQFDIGSIADDESVSRGSGSLASQARRASFWCVGHASLHKLWLRSNRRRRLRCRFGVSVRGATVRQWTPSGRQQFGDFSRTRRLTERNAASHSVQKERRCWLVASRRYRPSPAARSAVGRNPNSRSKAR